jgi:dihydroneopterin aldolase
MDSIQVRGIRCYGYTGYLEEERRLGQWFEVELTLWQSLEQAGASDNLEDTIDYRTAIAHTKQTIAHNSYVLLERLATEIANSILAGTSSQQVRVLLTKLAPPIPDFGGQITIDITRARLQ